MATSVELGLILMEINQDISHAHGMIGVSMFHATFSLTDRVLILCYLISRLIGLIEINLGGSSDQWSVSVAMRRLSSVRGCSEVRAESLH